MHFIYLIYLIKKAIKSVKQEYNNDNENSQDMIVDTYGTIQRVMKFKDAEMLKYRNFVFRMMVKAINNTDNNFREIFIDEYNKL